MEVLCETHRTNTGRWQNWKIEAPWLQAVIFWRNSVTSASPLPCLYIVQGPNICLPQHTISYTGSYQFVRQYQIICSVIFFSWHSTRMCHQFSPCGGGLKYLIADLRIVKGEKKGNPEPEEYNLAILWLGDINAEIWSSRFEGLTEGWWRFYVKQILVKSEEGKTNAICQNRLRSAMAQAKIDNGFVCWRKLRIRSTQKIPRPKSRRNCHLVWGKWFWTFTLSGPINWASYLPWRCTPSRCYVLHPNRICPLLTEKRKEGWKNVFVFTSNLK
jgi:hypothetical protein